MRDLMPTSNHGRKDSQSQKDEIKPSNDNQIPNGKLKAENEELKD